MNFLLKSKRSNTFYCFSPPVMLATFLIELAGAVYVVLRYKLNKIGRLVVAILVCLAVFQLAEFMICGAVGLPSIEWAKIGYLAITLLPPLGISLIMAICGKKSWLGQTLLYMLCAAFIFFFLFVNNSITGQVCLGNYIIFEAAPGVMTLYGVYYYSLLALSLFLALYWCRQLKNRKKRKALLALAIGYSSFIIPTVAVNLADPSTVSGIPSIMCGFAVLLAIILLIWVLPLNNKKRA